MAESRKMTGDMTVHECIACHAKSIPRIVRLHQGAALKGWHDVSSFVGGESLPACESGTKWLCERCTRGTLQCSKCMLRYPSAKQMCPSCNPETPSFN